jgi:hypothetical protein
MDGAGGEDATRAALATLRRGLARSIDTALVASTGWATRVARNATSLAEALPGGTAAAATLASLIPPAITVTAALLLWNTPPTTPFAVLGAAASAVPAGGSPTTLEATLGETALVEAATDISGGGWGRTCSGDEPGDRGS